MGTASSSCHLPTYPTISSAIIAASPGATIYVCAGTYPESLTIDKPLTLLGARFGNDARGRSGSETVITGAGGITYTTGATSGTIDGFTLNGYAGGTGEIVASNVGSNWQFKNNIIDVSNGGIYLNTNGIVNPAPSLIADNRFVQATPSWANSGDFGQAVLVWGNTGNNITVADNAFVNLSGPGAAINTSGGLNCGSSPDTSTFSNNLKVQGNLFVDNGASFIDPIYGLGFIDENFIALFCSTNANITSNKITITLPNDTNAVTPIFVSGGDWNTSVTGNTLVGNGASFASGIKLGSDFYAPGTGVTISQNRISGFLYGIHITGSSYGSDFAAPTGFLAKSNTITASVADGILINNGADNTGIPSGGTIIGNSSTSSAVYDCADFSSGSGTLGTANTWKDNAGSTSSPLGLCAGKPDKGRHGNEPPNQGSHHGHD